MGCVVGIWESVKQPLPKRWSFLGDWIYCYVARVKVSRHHDSGKLISLRLCVLTRLIEYLALIGTVEELAASPRTQTLVREQFETNFFGPVNVLKAAIPAMRKRNSGHIMILTGISTCFLCA